MSARICSICGRGTIVVRLGSDWICQTCYVWLATRWPTLWVELD